MFGDLDLVGQVVDDASIGLQPAEHERSGESLQTCSSLVVAVAFDRDRETFLERGHRTEQPGVDRLHDRPQLAQPVLDWCAGHRDAPVGAQALCRFGLGGVGVLHLLGLVESDPSPLDSGEGVDVAGEEAVGGEHDIVATAHLHERLHGFGP